MEYYSARKSNKLLIHAMPWMDPKGIMLSEKKPIPEHYILHDSIYITFSKLPNSIDGEKIGT